MSAPTREQVVQVIRSVYDRHDDTRPLNHVNIAEFVDALMPLIRAARAAELREAADESTEDGGAWDVLALYVSEAGHPYALAGIQRWLRERADRIESEDK